MQRFLLVLSVICSVICLSACNSIKPLEVHEVPEPKPPLNLSVKPLDLRDFEIQMQGDTYILDELNFQALTENQLKVLWKLREYQIILDSYQKYYEKE